MYINVKQVRLECTIDFRQSTLIFVLLNPVIYADYYSNSY